MAEHESEGADTNVEASRSMMGRYLGFLWKSFSRNDGTLAAAGRQGADEIGEALKPFPESIQTNEPGTILSPTQGEVAEARRVDESPSLAVNDNHIYDPRQDHGQEHHRSRGR